MKRPLLRTIGFVFQKIIKMKNHFLAWLVYAIYESVMIGFFTGEFGRIENYVVHYTLNIFVFYFHFWALNKIDFGNKRLTHLLIFPVCVIELVIYIPLLAIMNQLFTEYNQPTENSSFGITSPFIFGATYRCLFFLIISTGYWYLTKFLEQKNIIQKLDKQRLTDLIEMKDLEQHMLVIQNAQLRSQINPHFLFNSLSFIHQRIRKVDEDAAEMLVTLAEMMRYSAEITTEQEFVPLEMEIEQVEKLISIVRRSNTCKVYFSLSYSCDFLHLKIPPFLLSTLVENIFKHGVFTDPMYPPSLLISYSNQMLTIITNNKPSDSSGILSLGKGLVNLKERLFNSYAENAHLKWETGDFFVLQIDILC